MLDFNKRCAVAEFAHFSREFAFASAVGVDKNDFAMRFGVIKNKISE